MCFILLNAPVLPGKTKLYQNRSLFRNLYLRTKGATIINKIKETAHTIKNLSYNIMKNIKNVQLGLKFPILLNSMPITLKLHHSYLYKVINLN